MKTELTYLYEKLDDLPSDKVLTVADLKQLIHESFEQEAEDQERIDNSMNEIGHDM